VPHAPAHLARSAPLLAGLLVALALAAAPARALDLEIAMPHVRADRVWIDVRVGDLFAPRVQESLGRGMPATLQISAEVWRHRTGWFDRMTGSFATGIKIQYDVWTRTYRLEGQPIPDLAVSTIDSVRLVLSRPMELPLIRRDRLGDSGRFYVVVSATLKPLSVGTSRRARAGCRARSSRRSTPAGACSPRCRARCSTRCGTSPDSAISRCARSPTTSSRRTSSRAEALSARA